MVLEGIFSELTISTIKNDIINPMIKIMIPIDLKILEDKLKIDLIPEEFLLLMYSYKEYITVELIPSSERFKKLVIPISKVLSPKFSTPRKLTK
jgi:hypothetical protein